MAEQRSVSERGDSERGGHSPDPRHAAYADIAEREDFVDLKRRYRRFAFPATVAFMVWYITYVCFNNWARDFMDIRVVGNVNVAVVFGLLQFASTFLIAFLYARYSGRQLDPLARRLRATYEDDLQRREAGQ